MRRRDSLKAMFVGLLGAFVPVSFKATAIAPTNKPWFLVSQSYDNGRYDSLYCVVTPDDCTAVSKEEFDRRLSVARQK